MIATNGWMWAGFVGFVLGMVLLDLGVFNRTAHEIRPKEAAIWTGVWVCLALMFAAGLLLFAGREAALTFVTGYVIEESLSADNIFVMVLILSFFAIPKTSQHRVLFYGVLGALVMRGAFIGAGTLLLARFAWIIYLFGAMLVYAGVRMAWKEDETFDADHSPAVKLIRRFVPLTSELEGRRFFVRRNGRWMATPLVLVLVLVEVTDLVFAIDSIPAVFGITRDPFLVFTSNIFAVVGLRSLYFLLASAVSRFYLLKYGLAVILTFVGVRILAEPWFHLDILASLGIILGVLLVAIVASLVRPERPAEVSHGGTA